MTTELRSAQSYWDSRYHEWWDRPYHGMSQEPYQFMVIEELGIQAHLEALLQPHFRVLDAGCGYGRLAPRICALVAEYVGVDFARKAIEAAEAIAPDNARFVVGDILDADDGPYDVIVMCGAWSSIWANAAEVIDHLRSLLAPDGFILVFEYGSDRLITKDGTVECL